jgi:plasmid stabilization system protein ParE
VVGPCSRLRLARVGGCPSPRRKRSSKARACQRWRDVSAKVPSASKPGIGRRYEVFPDKMRHHELGRVVGPCSRLRLARVGGCPSPRRKRSSKARARQRWRDVSAKVPSASEPGIGRTYEFFPDIMRHHELGKGGGAVLAAAASPRGRLSLVAREAE